MKTVLVKRRLVRPETKVLHTSGYADEAIVQLRVQGQDYAFLERPFTRDDWVSSRASGSSKATAPLNWKDAGLCLTASTKTEL
jgi:hypothetical protein